MPAALTRRELLEAAGLTEALLTELEAFGLIRRVGLHYGPDALVVARTAVTLTAYGVEARHLRAVRAAAERETTMIESLVAPIQRQRGAGARELAARTAGELADLVLRLHGALVDGALAEAGLAQPGLAGEAGAAAGSEWTMTAGAGAASLSREPAHDDGAGCEARMTPPLLWRRGRPRLRVYFDKGSAFRRKGNASGQTRYLPQRAGADRDGAAVRQMEVVGVRVEMATNNPIVLLKETEGERYLPIWIGPNEATAIAFAQQGMVPQRPLTHDLMRDMLEALEIRLTTVNITALRDGIFFADLIFSNGREVSARPSDSIALALRTGASIFVRDEILDEAGVAIPDEQEDEVEKFREFLDSITPEDFGRST